MKILQLREFCDAYLICLHDLYITNFEFHNGINFMVIFP